MHGKTFGVEFEVIAPAGVTRQQMADKLNAAGVPAIAASYGSPGSTKWKATSDVSINGNGIEFVSPVLTGEAGLETIRKVCAVLTAAGCKVDDSCGYHVHIGAADLSMPAMRKLAILYSDYEPVLDKIMAPSRRANVNSYLQGLGRVTKAGIEAARDVRALATHILQDRDGRANRYSKLNFTSHWKHGTVEFRQHGGTTNGAKAIHWLLACIAMVRAAERTEAAPVAVAAHVAPRAGTALRVIYDLCARPEGCSREEARIALGRTSAPKMTRLTDDCGIALRKVGQRFFLAEVAAAAAPAADVISVDGWCAKLGLDADATMFFKAREEYFAAQTYADRIGFRPGSVAARRFG